MKYFNFILSCSLIFLVACSNNQNKSEAKNEKPEKKSSQGVTKEHVKIPGSDLYIIPPPGFAVNETIGNLGKGEEYANFIYMNLNNAYTLEKFFGELKTQADKDFPGSWKQEDIIADGHTATLYHYKNAGAMQYYLAFTDGHSDEMIIANFLESEAATGKEMYEAMKTVVVKK